MFNSSENILAKPPQRCRFVLFKMENEKKKDHIMVHAFSLNQFLAQIYMKHKWASEGTRRGEEKGGGGSLLNSRAVSTILDCIDYALLLTR